MRLPRTEWTFRLVSGMGGGLLRGLLWTTTTEVRGEEHLLKARARSGRVLLAGWHSRLLPLAWVHRGQGIVVLVSEHADGEYIARVLRGLGFGTVRGSSSRSGMRGLRGLIRAARQGADIAITPDGPRGPSEIVKAGVIAAARATGSPIVPVMVGASRAWVAESWDGFQVPKPFSRLTIEYGSPLWVPREGGPGTLEKARADLEAELLRLTESVDA